LSQSGQATPRVRTRRRPPAPARVQAQAGDAPTNRPPRPRYAEWWMRWLGYSIIDGLVVAGIGFVLGLILFAMFYASNEYPTTEEQNTFTGFVTFFAYAAAFVYFWISNSIGRSVGKLILGLRVVRKDTGEAPGAARGFLRTFGYVVSTIPLLLGFLWAAWDEDRQAWHDKMADTVVVSTAQKQALTVEEAEAGLRAEGRPPPAEPLPAEQSRREARAPRGRHRTETPAQRTKRRHIRARTQAGAGLAEERLHEDSVQEPAAEEAEEAPEEPAAETPQQPAPRPPAAAQPRERVCPNCRHRETGDRTSCPHCGMPLAPP
jgi:uncharacterized RDD family membrane protein YckC